HEVAMRARLPAGVRMFTGDDFNYPELILGDGAHHSDALLGIFDAIAPAASAALQALDAGDEARYREVLEPTVALPRHVFQAPTYDYKTGVVFLAYLNGFQDHFRMVAGMESARSVTHLAELFVLADRAGVLLEPELAVERMRLVLRLAGVEAGSRRRRPPPGSGARAPTRPPGAPGAPRPSRAGAARAGPGAPRGARRAPRCR